MSKMKIAVIPAAYGAARPLLMSTSGSFRERAAAWLANPHARYLAAAFLAGAALRFWEVGGAILIDDEFHAIGAAQSYTFLGLFTHFGEADHCIPLAMWYKFLIPWAGLGDWSVRLPMLLSSLVFCAAVPLLVYPAVRSSALGWLIAIAPYHIFYSRYARPYSIAFLLGFLSVLALWRAIRSADRRWFCLAAPCAILAPWFSLSFLPPLAAAGAAVSVWACTARGRALRAAWAASFFTVLGGWCVLLLPPLLTDSAALYVKAGPKLVVAAALPWLMELFTGVCDLRLGVLLVAAAAFGLFVLLRREPWLGLLLTLAAGAQFTASLATHPDNIVTAAMLGRYTLFIHALFLVSLAAAAARAVEACTGRLRKPAVAALALLCLGLFRAGPLPRLLELRPEWRSHGAFQGGYAWAKEGDFSRYGEKFRLKGFPPFYSALKKLPPGSVKLLEAPWHYASWLNPLPFYQAYHRQKNAIAFVGKVAGRGRGGEWPLENINSRFSYFEELGSAGFNTRARADLLVIHKSWPAEQPDMPGLAGESEDMTRVLSFCRARYGPPSYEDALLSVFPLTAAARALPLAP